MNRHRTKKRRIKNISAAALRAISNREKYAAPHEIKYYSARYHKCVTVKKGFYSDGATGAVDIYSDGWWVHDKLCESGVFDDGTPCTNLQASIILSDILNKEGRFIRSKTWFMATWLLGGGKARDNGMW